LTNVVALLDRLGIDYMVTGSVVSSLQGEPRASHDIDVVVALPAEKVDDLNAAFPSPRYYLSTDAVLDALRHRSMFNVLDSETGDKVDFWLLTDSPFDQTRFARRQMQTLFGSTMKISTPEDTILAKLQWMKLSGGSEKQLHDALRVYEVQHSLLDHAYLQQWVNDLQVQDEWAQLRQQASPPP